MGSGIFFPICGLPIILIILVSFNAKKHIDSKETKLFNMLIIVNLIGLIIEILCSYACKIYEDNYLLSDIILKSYLVYLITWTDIFATYVALISNVKDSKFVNILKKVHILVLLIIIFIIYFLPIDVVIENNFQVHYTKGLSVNFSYSVSAIYIVFILYFLLKNIRKLNNKKYFPVFLFFAIGTTAILIQKMYPQFLLLTYSETIICLCMYFTIENPDVKMIEQLNIAREQADKANRAKTDFLSSMSHEIRTPLNAIVGFSELIQTSETLEEAKENANDIVGASQTLLEIVNGILDISKIEAGKIEIHNSAYNAHELFDGIVKLGKGRLGEKPLDYRINIAPDLPDTLYGDHANLKKIVINLLTNAIKYTDKGYVDFSVKCVNTNDVCRLIISVEDSGRGIKTDDINKLFTKFQRLDEDRNTTIEGTGLGLAITKQLIDLMGGKIVVHSTYGEGSKFTVAIDQKISNEKLVSDKVETVDNLDLTGKKILIVDDNKLNLKVASKILETYKPTLDLVESGMECLDKINSGNKYDLILMDDMMPRMNGTETLHRLKQIENFNTPVVILTANALSGQEQKYLNDGFDSYLSKPIDKEKLHEVLSKFLKSNEVKVEEKSVEIEQPKIEENKPDTLDLSNKKILIVDDNKLNIKVESKILETYKPNIDSVLSGEECINILKTNTYDLIFMDDMMPNLSGVETLKKLKENPNFNIPVVILTANAIEGMKEQYLNAGFIDYLSKPIDKAELNRVLNEIFNNTTNDIEIPKQEETNQFKTIEYLKNNNINIDKSLELLGDIDTYNETLEEFYNGIKERVLKLQKFKDTNDLKNYAIEAHALKSDSKYLGFTKLAELSLNHEMKSKENDLDYIKNDFNNLINCLADELTIVKKYLGK